MVEVVFVVIVVIVLVADQRGPERDDHDPELADEPLQAGRPERHHRHLLSGGKV